MLTIVSDIILTDSFLIKGEIEQKYARLSQVLDEYRRYFLRIRNATLIDLNTCDRIQTPLLHVNMDEILLAHEFLDTAGDPNKADLYKGVKFHQVRVFFTGHLNVEVGGEVRPGSYEVDDRATRRFFVIKSPQMRGFNPKEDNDLKLLTKLPYAVVNKTRLSYIYDFNE
ncbi:MAG: hypothetical protein HZA52_19500 [Planctomycetes bacterium]|nr:hypothetical protein [Planctomycetota bacterium]